jgi:hypothetical protein
LVISEHARGAGVGLARTDTVSVLNAGDMASRAKEEEKATKTATVAVSRNGSDFQNQKTSDSG